jgi:steroid 5-alpha reductase family enzyme
VDIFWGLGFVVTNWAGFLFTMDGSPRKWLLGILVTIWGLRLSIHILVRNSGKPEDFRYVKWRQEAGEQWWWRSLFRVFIVQGVLMWIISTPLLVVQYYAGIYSITGVDILAVIIWGIGFTFESMGDLQLTRFKSDPANRGKVMGRGVWKYTRHPNYFGDAAQWWGYYLLAVAAGGFWCIFSPILMTFFLYQVSGVKLLEKTIIETREGYKEYIESTSAFIPWFPKRKKGG